MGATQSHAYRIKPLDWTVEFYGAKTIAACTIFGPLVVRPDNGCWLVMATELGVRMFRSSRDEAKSAAETWYREKLLNALEAVE